MQKASGFVYAIQFYNGAIKVGMSRSPKARLGAYKSYCDQAKTSECRRWISPVVVNARAEEKGMIELCKALGEKLHGKEWFSGVDFDELIGTVIKEIKIATPEDLKAEAEEREARIENMVDLFISRFFPKSGGKA